MKKHLFISLQFHNNISEPKSIIPTSIHPKNKHNVKPHMIVRNYHQYNNLDVFVYCGGKCGSTTLEHTFKKQNYNTIHIHRNLQFTRHILELYNTRNQIQRSKIPVVNNNALFTSFDVIRYNKQQKNQIYIIDSYRTPIERKISSFFQNLNKHCLDYTKYNVNQLITIFNEKCIYELEEYHSIDEVLEHFGLPKFTTFDFDKKYNVFKTNKITFIKIRFNEIGEWGSILSEIFNKPITIHNANLTENKDIYQLYLDFKKKYKVPEKYLREYLPEDVNFKIYNSEEEQTKYIEKWEKAIIC